MLTVPIFALLAAAVPEAAVLKPVANMYSAPGAEGCPAKRKPGH